MNSDGSVVIRRTAAQALGRAPRDCLEYRHDHISWNPFAKEKFTAGDWAPFPANVSDLEKKPIWQYVGNQLFKQVCAQEKQCDGVDDIGDPAIEFSRFLRRAGLVPADELQQLSKLPPARYTAGRTMALGYHQAAVAVGTYFNDASLLPQLPTLGVLMGNPSAQILRDTFRFGNLAAAVAARGLAEILPEGRAVKVSFAYSEQIKSVSWDGPDGHKEIRDVKAEIYAQVADSDTREILCLIPMAFEVSERDSSASDDDTITTRTQWSEWSEMKQANFERTAVGCFKRLEVSANMTVD